MKLAKSLKITGLKTPYTIKKALYVDQSHYVGYTLVDSQNVKFDVFDIFLLKKCISAYPKDFTNVKIDSISGQLDIEDMDNLSHVKSKAIDKTIPSKVYDLKLYPSGFVRLEVSKPFKAHIKKLVSSNSTETLIMPPPLLYSFGQKVDDCFKCFTNIDFGDLDVDFSLVDLRYCKNIKKFFENSKIKHLKVSYFNFAPYNFESAFGKIKCETLDLSNFDFSNTEHFGNRYFLDGCDIKKLIAKNVTGVCFIQGKMKIDEFDLGFFSNIEFKHYYYSQYDIFKNFQVKKFVNTHKLNLNGCKMAAYLFAGLTIDVLDLRKFDLSTITNFSNFLADLKCKKLILNDDMFVNAENMSNLFKNCLIESDLDLSNLDLSNTGVNATKKMFNNLKVKGMFTPPTNFGNCTNFEKTFANIKAWYINLFAIDLSKATNVKGIFENILYQDNLDLSSINLTNLNEDGAFKMFSGAKIEGKLIPPTSYGNCTNFAEMFSKLNATELDLSNINLSKATNMNKFLYKAKVNEGITFPKKKNLIPTNLLETEQIFKNLSTEFIDISKWDKTITGTINFDFSYIRSYKSNNGFVLDAFDNRVLSFNIPRLIVPSNSDLCQLFSTEKSCIFFYTHKAVNTSTTEFFYDKSIIPFAY